MASPAMSDGFRALARLPIARQGVRFAAVGCLVALVYLGMTTLLSAALGLPFEVALPIGYAVALSVHFTLQRLFVWKSKSGYALDIHVQVGRYLCVAVAQYTITAVVTAEVPQRIGVSKEIVFLFTATALMVTTFLLFRTSVFHGSDQALPNGLTGATEYAD